MSSRKKARGRRQLNEVTVETFTIKDDGDGQEVSSSSSAAASAAASTSASKESTPSSAHSAAKDKDPSGEQLNFVSGNPFVEVTNGVLHLYKENHTTSLEEGVIRSQMLCKHILNLNLL